MFHVKHEQAFVTPVTNKRLCDVRHGQAFEQMRSNGRSLSTPLPGTGYPPGGAVHPPSGGALNGGVLMAFTISLTIAHKRRPKRRKLGKKK